jgi:very-short-patch-repair endonuclease
MRIWLAVRNRRLGGFKFVRQETIGPYVADFVCRERKLIVELDGGQHSENNRDRVRDAFLAAEGYLVLRFWNNDVMKNRDGVLAIILAELGDCQEFCA